METLSENLMKNRSKAFYFIPPFTFCLSYFLKNLYLLEKELLERWARSTVVPAILHNHYQGDSGALK